MFFYLEQPIEKRDVKRFNKNSFKKNRPQL